LEESCQWSFRADYQEQSDHLYDGPLSLHGVGNVTIFDQTQFYLDPGGTLFNWGIQTHVRQPSQPFCIDPHLLALEAEQVCPSLPLTAPQACFLPDRATPEELPCLSTSRRSSSHSSSTDTSLPSIEGSIPTSEPTTSSHPSNTLQLPPNTVELPSKNLHLTCDFCHEPFDTVDTLW
jgi:hypothetical protein